MHKFAQILLLLFIAVILSGCLVFNKISYEIVMSDSSAGSASVAIYDIRSDAKTPFRLEEDINYLYNYSGKSKKFIEQMKLEGKEITGRELEIKEDTVIGYLSFNFNSLSAFGNITFDAGFYILTLSPTDSIIATNGQVLRTKNDLRILWDEDIEKISYTLMGNSFEKEGFTKLAPYYK